MVDIISEILNIPNIILEAVAPTEPPFSSIFILLVAVTVQAFSTLLSRKMIDIDKLTRLTRETKEFNKLKTQARKTADKKLQLKVDRESDRMRKLQSDLSMMRMKPIMILMIPMMAFFIIMSGFYDWRMIDGIPTGNLPAVIPFPLPEVILFFQIGKYVYDPTWGNVFIPNYVWWYFGGSIVASSIMQKIAGLQPD